MSVVPIASPAPNATDVVEELLLAAAQIQAFAAQHQIDWNVPIPGDRRSCNVTGWIPFPRAVNNREFINEAYNKVKLGFPDAKLVDWESPDPPEGQYWVQCIELGSPSEARAKLLRGMTANAVAERYIDAMIRVRQYLGYGFARFLNFPYPTDLAKLPHQYLISAGLPGLDAPTLIAAYLEKGWSGASALHFPDGPFAGQPCAIELRWYEGDPERVVSSIVLDQVTLCRRYNVPLDQLEVFSGVHLSAPIEKSWVLVKHGGLFGEQVVARTKLTARIIGTPTTLGTFSAQRYIIDNIQTEDLPING